MITYGMGGTNGASCKIVDLKWALKVKKIKLTLKRKKLKMNLGCK